MTQTAINVPSYVTMIEPEQTRSISALASFAAELLLTNSDLPGPRYFSVSQGGRELSLQFGDSPDSFRALARWAERFGGTVTGQPHTRADGRQTVHCEVKFTDHGVNVQLYAYITVQADQAT